MKTRFVLSLFIAALLPSCTTVKTASNTKPAAAAPTADGKTNLYAANSAADPAPPGAEDIPAEGPTDLKANPALIPTPLLRDSAASRP